MASSASRRSNDRRAGEIARAAVSAVAELTGRQPETVLALRADDEGWKVTVEVVELSRIPSSTDVMASYQVTLDSGGELVGYERIRRYQRGDTGEERR